MKLAFLLFPVMLSLGLSGVGHLSAAEPQGRFFFKSYGPEQGLVEPALTTLIQDESGFIWIASENGLIQYDGTQFRGWTSRDGLPSSFINGVLSIPGGGIWVSTNKGLVRFQNGKMTPLLMDGKPIAVRIALMQLDGQGALWLMREDGLYRQNGANTVERVSGRPPGWGKAMAIRPSTGSVFMAVGHGLWERRADGTVVEWGKAKGDKGDSIEALTVDGKGRLWVVGTRSLRYLDASETTFHDVSSWLPAGPFQGCIINVNPDGSVAIPTNAGLLSLRGNEHEVLNEAMGLPCKWTASSLVDREGNLWVVGPKLYRQLGRGLVRGFTSQEGLPSDLVWCVYRDPLGRLWAGTGEGVAQLGPRGWAKVPGTEGLSVTSLVMDGTGRLWIGSNNEPPFCLEPGTTQATPQAFQKLRKVSEGPRMPSPGRSSSLLLDHSGNLWLGDPSSGLYRIDLKAHTIKAEYGPGASHIPGLTVHRVAEDDKGRLWMATNHGVVLRDDTGWHRWDRADGLCDDTVQGVVPLPDGSCWLIYQEALGISRVEFKNGALHVLAHKDASHGGSSDRVYAVGVDRWNGAQQGGLWIASDRGVDCIRGAECFHIGQGGGLSGEDCSENALMIESSGDVWVGTSTGLAHILPGFKPGLTGTPPVQIQQVLRGKVRLTPPFSPLPPLSYRDGTLEFRFACPTYVNERAVQYQVRLLGLEDEWRISDVPQARYGALPGGKYTFEVRAASYPGQPFGPAATYRVEVLAPWWRSWWFILLVTFGGAGLVTLFLNWRLRTLAAQKKKLARLVDRRTADLLHANHALEKANLALKAQSLTDPLTGLHNRRFLSVVVDEDVASVARLYRVTPPGVALPNQDLLFFMVDLDHFKQVNDEHGHGVGDRVLERVADALRKAARETDGVIRWGGEEFLILARNCSRSEAHLMAERIRSIMAEQVVVLDSGEVLTWTCSVGFVAYPFQLEDPTWMGWERLVEIADACLYLAKKAGRDGWVGAQAKPSLSRALHGSRLPWELQELREEGVLDLQASRVNAFVRPPRSGGNPIH